MADHTNDNQEFPKSDVAKREEDVLDFWKHEQIFEQSVSKDALKGDFVFYDGPPFGTGQPHYGHLLPGTIKDVIPRYKTMQGYKVQRKWGWDCHGLPVENLIEKELGLNSKKDIEEYGIDRFNEAARSSVLRYESDWKEVIPRTGRWVDMDHAYMSMHPDYTQSVWWSFKQLYDKGLVYEGFKSMHLCPRCETTLSNFEVNQGYKDIKDLSVIAKFELVDEPGTYVLAWTTTPWTLPGNVALAVNPGVAYSCVRVVGGDMSGTYYVASERLEEVFKGYEYEVVSSCVGSELVGKSYKPLFDYFAHDENLDHRENGWKIYGADFVTTDDGTGVVHIAPAFGEDDYQLLLEHQLPFVQHVDRSGHFVPAVTDFSGRLVKPKDDHMSTDIEIVKWLAHNGKLFSKEKYEHSYPHCWRCDTPLLNYATSSWFLKVTDLKDRLLEENAQVSWVPDHMKEGRFGKWLEGARDWALSRSRYWGAALPVWKNSATGKHVVIGSFEELQKYTKPSSNTYHIMRHGQSDSNVKQVLNSDPGRSDGLTDEGREQVREAAVKVRELGITKVYVSPFQRTQETVSVLKQELGWSDDMIVTDARLGENQFGEFDNGPHDHLRDYFAGLHERYVKPFPGGESDRDVRKRMLEVLFEIEQENQDETILIVSHASPLWMLHSSLSHNDYIEYLEIVGETHSGYMDNAEVRALPFIPFPHNGEYEFDVHRPYIDRLALVDSDGESLELLGDVFDVWYESGSMPYASLGYPFENTEVFENVRFPADFIAEGLDQTRGWFYVMLVLGVALFDRSPYKHVVVNGLVLAEDGKKMSKRLKNYPPIEQVLNTYGADAFRLFLMNSPAVRSEEVRFSEKAVQEVASKVVGRFRNMLTMYTLVARDGEGEYPFESPHVLDQWMLARVVETRSSVTDALEGYEIDRAARPLFDLIDDLSTWYVRRSRDRYKDDGKDGVWARESLRFCLRATALLIAPFAPFVADEVWQIVRYNQDPASVHLADWNEVWLDEVSSDVLSEMQRLRSVVSVALLGRDTAGIKVRQPVAEVVFSGKHFHEGFEQLFLDEVNVKKISYGSLPTGEGWVLAEDGDMCIALDSKLTDELEREGIQREILRTVQSLRKKAGLSPDDQVVLHIASDEAGNQVVQGMHDELARVAGISHVEYSDTVDGEYTGSVSVYSYEVGVGLQV